MTARRGTAAADPTQRARSESPGRTRERHGRRHCGSGSDDAFSSGARPTLVRRLGRPVAITAERPVVPGQHSLGAIRTRALRALRQRQRASYPAPKAALDMLIVHRPNPRWRVSAADLSFTAIDLDAHSAPRGCKVRKARTPSSSWPLWHLTVQRDRMRLQRPSALMRRHRAEHGPGTDRQPSPAAQDGPIAWDLEVVFELATTSSGENHDDGCA